MLRRLYTLKGKVGGANGKLCEWMEVHSSTTGHSVEGKWRAKYTEATWRPTGNLATCWRPTGNLATRWRLAVRPS
eukprot:5924275-Prymnesium_polylepis.1